MADKQLVPTSPSPISIKVTRKDFSAFYALLYDTINNHIQKASVKLRGWAIWEQWKSKGLRKRMSTQASVSKIIYGKRINLAELTRYIFEKFSFLTQYIRYKVDKNDPKNVLHYTSLVTSLVKNLTGNDKRGETDDKQKENDRVDSETYQEKEKETAPPKNKVLNQKLSSIMKNDGFSTAKNENHHLLQNNRPTVASSSPPASLYSKSVAVSSPTTSKKSKKPTGNLHSPPSSKRRVSAWCSRTLFCSKASCLASF